MDIIGTMYEPYVEGQEPVALVGWYVNTSEPVVGWESFEVFPKVPYRIYAGAPTFFYMFPDEATFTQEAIAAGLLPAPEGT